MVLMGRNRFTLLHAQVLMTPLVQMFMITRSISNMGVKIKCNWYKLEIVFKVKDIVGDNYYNNCN